jgi:hypothetical protein
MESIIDELIFRSSAVNDLCGKSGLGVTGEKLAIYNYLETKYGRRKEFTSKYTDKGLQCEEGAIKALSLLENKSYVKNEIRIYNKFITGECDIDNEQDNEIIDIKNSWDLFTFHDSKTANVNKYETQGQCYMELYKRSSFRLIHMLEDAPDNLVLAALEKEGYKHKDGLTPEWIEVEIIKNMIYTKENFIRFLDIRCLGGDELTEKCIESFIEIPQAERISIKTFKRDAKKYDFVKSRVTMARTFLKTIYPND